MTEIRSDVMDEPGSPSMAAVAWIEAAPRAWTVTLLTLLQVPGLQRIHVGFGPAADKSLVDVSDPRVVVHDDVALSDLVDHAIADGDDALLFCTWPGKPSPETFDIAVEAIRRDPRIGTVSFLSNAAGAFSFPHRNQGTPFGVDGHDEVSLTRLLRARNVSGAKLTPVQAPDGAMVVVSAGMLSACGGLDDYGTSNLALALTDIAFRGAKKGFGSYLDASSYLTMPSDGVPAYASVLLNDNARHALHLRHSHFPLSYDTERLRPNSVLGEALDCSRASATGIRVLIDGSAIGPKEMGTQLLTLKLSTALADREDVQKVVIGVPDPANVPAYAQGLLRHRKIQVIGAGQLDFPDAPMVDVIHRPYQPSSPIPWDRWRGLAKRSAITVQDLIAYRNPNYFADGAAWLNYRDNFQRQIAQSDAVMSISHDVVSVIEEERLPIDPSRVHVVENGADARSKDEPTSIPSALLERQWASSPFLFVLGANYAHKNRDMAIRVWARLRALGYPHKLVMAGAAVPYGSARVEEALLTTPSLTDHILTLPDVSSAERNWLIANSSLVVYLTAAEGFGLVPFEAASLDVPALYVSFGPLRELVEDAALPVSYKLEHLVARAQILLDDPAASRASIVNVLKSIDRLTWDEAARKSVEAYRKMLHQPSRVHGL